MILEIKTRQQTELINITDKIGNKVRAAGIDKGLCMVYVPHTTAAVTINESADPCVAEDILMALNKIVPRTAPFQHLEGNSPAHVKASLVGASELIAIEGGALLLGTWQGIFFCEFDGPRTRQVYLNFIDSNITSGAN
ncbi:MAG: secondary thiamine-phosphate synthase enzyme YjbQ [Desulfobacterales bacterium]|jgi:secondary thiamine-phosphate synthase enzyme|nr:secondary thiamine-phosphate synthase enzyme YjbQ [Desulfobacterales bacterium]